MIHPRFETHHRPVVEGAMTVVLRISRPSSTRVRDPGTGLTDFGAPTVVYEGPGGMWVVGASTATELADRLITVGTYSVSTPVSAPPGRVGDVVDLLECPGDDAVIGVRLHVTDAPLAGISWERVLGCQRPTTTP